MSHLPEQDTERSFHNASSSVSTSLSHVPTILGFTNSIDSMGDETKSLSDSSVSALNQSTNSGSFVRKSDQSTIAPTPPYKSLTDQASRIFSRYAQKNDSHHKKLTKEIDKKIFQSTLTRFDTTSTQVKPSLTNIANSLKEEEKNHYLKRMRSKHSVMKTDFFLTKNMQKIQKTLDNLDYSDAHSKPFKSSCSTQVEPASKSLIADFATESFSELAVLAKRHFPTDPIKTTMNSSKSSIVKQNFSAIRESAQAELKLKDAPKTVKWRWLYFPWMQKSKLNPSPNPISSSSQKQVSPVHMHMHSHSHLEAMSEMSTSASDSMSLTSSSGEVPAANAPQVIPTQVTPLYSQSMEAKSTPSSILMHRNKHNQLEILQSLCQLSGGDASRDISENFEREYSKPSIHMKYACVQDRREYENAEKKSPEGTNLTNLKSPPPLKLSPKSTHSEAKKKKTRVRRFLIVLLILVASLNYILNISSQALLKEVCQQFWNSSKSVQFPKNMNWIVKSKDRVFSILSNEIPKTFPIVNRAIQSIFQNEFNEEVYKKISHSMPPLNILDDIHTAAHDIINDSLQIIKENLKQTLSKYQKEQDSSGNENEDNVVETVDTNGDLIVNMLSRTIYKWTSRENEDCLRVQNCIHCKSGNSCDNFRFWKSLKKPFVRVSKIESIPSDLYTLSPVTLDALSLFQMELKKKSVWIEIKNPQSYILRPYKLENKSNHDTFLDLKPNQLRREETYLVDTFVLEETDDSNLPFEKPLVESVSEFIGNFRNGKSHQKQEWKSISKEKGKVKKKNKERKTKKRSLKLLRLRFPWVKQN